MLLNNVKKYLKDEISLEILSNTLQTKEISIFLTSLLGE